MPPKCGHERGQKAQVQKTSGRQLFKCAYRATNHRPDQQDTHCPCFSMVPPLPAQHPCVLCCRRVGHSRADAVKQGILCIIQVGRPHLQGSQAGQRFLPDVWHDAHMMHRIRHPGCCVSSPPLLFYNTSAAILCHLQNAPPATPALHVASRRTRCWRASRPLHMQICMLEAHSP